MVKGDIDCLAQMAQLALNDPPEKTKARQMFKLKFIGNDDTVYDLEVQDGSTVMENAVRNGVPGIEAECCGSCACATCHVQVPDAWLARLDPQSDMELAMLEFADSVTDNSRLGCQISVGPDLSGITVHLPESQH